MKACDLRETYLHITVWILNLVYKYFNFFFDVHLFLKKKVVSSILHCFKYELMLLFYIWAQFICLSYFLYCLIKNKL